MSEHTPGPWVFECEDVGSYGSTFWLDSENGEEIICQSEDPYEGVLIKGDDFIANARLIAAAPEMLEALEVIERYSTCKITREVATEAVAKAKGQAINRAEGETE